MPTDRRAYMRDYMARKRSAERAAKETANKPVDRPVDMPTQPAVIGQIRRLPGGPDYVDMGTLPIAVGVPNPRDGSNIVSTGHAKPSFLAAPDDDCAACGHDRHTYHLDGACRMPIAPKRRCGCPAFVPALDEEVPF